MKLKYIKAQSAGSPSGPDDAQKPPSFLWNMKAVTYNGNSVFSENAQRNIRNYLLSTGYKEIQQFYFYQGRLYFSKMFSDDILKTLIPSIVEPSVYEPSNNEKVKIHDPHEVKLFGKEEIASPTWELVDISGGISNVSGLPELIRTTMTKLGFTNKDFESSAGTVFVNTNSKAVAKNAVPSKFVGKSPLNCIIQILKDNKLIQDEKDVSTMPFFGIGVSSRQDWVIYQFPVKGAEEEKGYSEKIEAWLNASDFSENSDYENHMFSGYLRLNRVSAKYENLIKSIHEFEKENGYHSSFPRHEEEKVSEKNWKEVSFSFEVYELFDLDAIAEDLFSKGFVEGMDYARFNKKLLMNVRSDNYVKLQFMLFKMARDRKYGINGVSIDYESGSPKKIPLETYWGSIVPKKFTSPEYASTNFESLFVMPNDIVTGEGPKTDRDIFLIIKYYAEKGVEALLMKGISDFYANYMGEIFYPRSSMDEVEGILSGLEEKLSHNLVVMKNVQAPGPTRENFVKSIMGEEKYKELRLSGQDTERKIVDNYWEWSESPFTFFRPMNDEETNKILNLLRKSEEENKDEKKFYMMSDTERIEVVRRLLTESQIYPGYDYGVSEEAAVLVVDDSKRFESLALARGINLGGDYKRHYSRLYEYVVSMNNMNCLKVNSFFLEFTYNAGFEANALQIDSALIIMVEYVFYDALNKFRDKSVFAPIPGDTKKTKKRNESFLFFIRLVNVKTIFDKSTEIAQKVFTNAEGMYEKIPTVASFKISPYYKDVSRLVNSYLAQFLSATISSENP